MAGDWLKVEKDTPEKPEVLAIASILGISQGDAFLACFKWWRWLDSHCVDGNVPSVTSDMVSTIAGRSGFSDALVQVGWLHARSGSLQVPNFDHHMGQTAKSRASTSKRVRAHRASVTQRVTEDVTSICNGDSVTEPLPEKRRDLGGIDSSNAFDLKSEVQEFLARWNKTPGTRPCPDQFSIGAPSLLSCFYSPAWREAWPKALEKFPLKCFDDGVSVVTFLGEDFVFKVLANHYNFEPSKSKNDRKRTVGPGQSYDPTAKDRDPQHGVF